LHLDINLFDAQVFAALMVSGRYHNGDRHYLADSVCCTLDSWAQLCSEEAVIFTTDLSSHRQTILAVALHHASLPLAERAQLSRVLADSIVDAPRAEPWAGGDGDVQAVVAVRRPASTDIVTGTVVACDIDGCRKIAWQAQGVHELPADVFDAAEFARDVVVLPHMQAAPDLGTCLSARVRAGWRRADGRLFGPPTNNRQTFAHQEHPGAPPGVCHRAI
jgi:hypothetical protein